MNGLCCKTCRFWNRNGDPWEAPGNEQTDWEPIATDKQKCLNVLHANGAGAPLTAPAIVTDGSGYGASFWTAPTFGCSSYEPKCVDCNEPASFAGYCAACYEQRRIALPVVRVIDGFRMGSRDRTCTIVDLAGAVPKMGGKLRRADGQTWTITGIECNARGPNGALLFAERPTPSVGDVLTWVDDGD